MPAYTLESRKGQGMDAKATHSNLKNLPNAVVKETPPDVGAGGAAAAMAGAAAGAGMVVVEEGRGDVGTYNPDAVPAPAVVAATSEPGSVVSVLKAKLLGYGLEPTDLPKVSQRIFTAASVLVFLMLHHIFPKEKYKITPPPHTHTFLIFPFLLFRLWLRTRLWGHRCCSVRGGCATPSARRRGWGGSC